MQNILTEYKNTFSPENSNYTLFFIRAIYKNSEAQICPKIKNKLRTIEARLQL